MYFYRRFGTTYGPIFEGHIYSFTLEDGTEKLSRNVGNKLPIHAA